MPSATQVVRLANGQSLLLGPQDRVVKEITIQCESGRCPSRHGQDKPVEFVFDDQGQFPETGDSFLSLVLPERSPSNPGAPRCFCTPGCLKDYLTYQYLAPGPRQPAPEPNPLTAEQLTGLNSQASSEPPAVVRKTDNLPEPLTMADVEAHVGSHDLPEPTVIGQADGVGE